MLKNNAFSSVLSHSLAWCGVSIVVLPQANGSSIASQRLGIFSQKLKSQANTSRPAATLSHTTP